MNAISIYNLETFPICTDERKVNHIDSDFYIFNDLRLMPSYDKPTRIDTTVISICLNGFTRVGINMQEYYITPGTLLISLPDQVLQSIEVSPDYQSVCIAMSREFSDETYARIKIMLPFFFYTKDYPCISLSQRQLERILDYFNLIWKKTNEEHGEFLRDIICNLIVSLYYEIYDVYNNKRKINIPHKTRQESLFDYFMRSLSSNFKKERSVNFYAYELCVTPKHLSCVVKEVSGRTAGEWIDNFVINEAKSLLSGSKKNIQEIADDLNFANQSFFGKYFKNCTGVSPKEFRKQ
ncbi:AraC family transcriptional regulator [Bacteroides sp. 214]|uniref:AraC family transcriptional regulator n=1 Tax=Bacteroides sp. 214 TaxID=2302935 RepID=UPI0013D5919C|nr:helix-turn-helix domain-containing protein [Bacteroides sp. 214]NDW11566.1 AraC family transcriptional regulator [Bacteroides sp. 214]